MKRAIEDLVNRRPVWEALSALFLDTELDTDVRRRLVRVLASSVYTLDELESILYDEVYPVLIGNLWCMAGEWNGFDLDWLETRLLERLARPKWWPRIPRWLQMNHWMVREGWQELKTHVQEYRGGLPTKETGLGRAASKVRRIPYDATAPSKAPKLPGFMARPDDAPAYHGFNIIPQTSTDGWVYGAITEFETDEPQTEGDGFVVAPDGSRAGIAWATDTSEFYEISPPDEARWRVYGVCFPRPVSSLDDLVFNFRAILPRLKERYETLRKPKT